VIENTFEAELAAMRIVRRTRIRNSVRDLARNISHARPSNGA
jgi:hypothetical protein